MRSFFPGSVENPIYITPGYVPPDLKTQSFMYSDYFKGACVHKNGFTYLEISTPHPAGDAREDPPYINPFLQLAGVGLHLVDYNLALDDLIEAVKLQAAAAQ